MKSIILKPLSQVFSLAVDLREWFYNKSLIPSRGVKAKVISVGNITLGGTGKTPLADVIVRYLLEKNKSVGLVSRGYGAKDKVNGVIDHKNIGLAEMARMFGDEPALLQWNNPKLHVSINANRFEACQALLQKKEVDVIVADDAFQHRSLKRDLDIVLLDATENLDAFHMFPAGRMREDFSALARADLVILNKTNLVSPEKLHNLRELIFLRAPELKNVPEKWLEASYDFAGFYQLIDNTLWEKSSFEKVLLVSGIANNESFFKMCREKLGGQVVGELGFKDHFNYTTGDYEMIRNKASELRADRILITEKDAVKMSQWKTSAFIYSKLKMSLNGQGQSLYDKINQVVS